MIPLRARADRASSSHDRFDGRVWLLDRRPHTHRPTPRPRLPVEPDDELAPDGFDLYLDPSRTARRRRRSARDRAAGSLSTTSRPATSSRSQKTDSGCDVLWRHDSRQNSVLLTERCDNYCLMCSQPPKDANDDWLLDDARELVRLLPPDDRADHLHRRRADPVRRRPDRTAAALPQR